VLDCSLGELEPDALVTVVAQLSPNEGQESVLIIGAVTSELGCEASSLDNEATLEVSLASKPIEPGDELQVAGGCTCEAATSRGTRAAWLPVVAFGALAALRHRRKDAQKGRARSA
jgi:MYXO-CTERM domain-containing protein